MDSSSIAILEEIQTTNRLLALMLTKGLNQTEAIKILAETGLQPKVIGSMLGIPPTTVRARLSESRTSTKRKR